MARRIFERFTELTLSEVLSESVRVLAREMRRLHRPVPGVYFVRSGDFIKIGFRQSGYPQKRAAMRQPDRD